MTATHATRRMLVRSGPSIPGNGVGGVERTLVARPITKRPVDESMSLINQTRNNPIDPSYQDAVERRRSKTPLADGESNIKWTFDFNSSSIMTIVIAVLLGIGGITAVHTLQEPSRDEERAEIKRRIVAAEDDLTQREKKLADLRSEINKLGRDALRKNRPEAAEELSRLELISGTRDVQGPGLSLTISEPQKPVSKKQEDIDLARVMDSDLQTVVNGLWASGAEAISVNGQRLGVNSTIRVAGSAITVNARSLSPPYQIDVIGNQSEIVDHFVKAEAWRHLNWLSEQYGITSTMKQSSMLTMTGVPADLLIATTPPETHQGRRSAKDDN